LIYLYVRHPSRLPEMRQVFADADVADSLADPKGE
jgi:hypothetical protein